VTLKPILLMVSSLEVLPHQGNHFLSLACLSLEVVPSVMPMGHYQQEQHFHHHHHPPWEDHPQE